jgi:preprotein translocase subunit SecA
VDGLFQAKEAQVGADTMRQLEKHIMLTVVDNAWKDHLANMDYLRQGIYLVGYAQQDPKQAFKRESFKLFSEMLDRIKAEVVQMLARIRIRSEEEVAAMEAEQQRLAERLQTQMLATGGGAPANAFAAPSIEASGNTGNYQRLPEPDTTARRSVATIRARAAQARSTNIATGNWPDPEVERLLLNQEKPR